MTTQLSTQTTRFQVRHADIAREARRHKGEWILVRHYPDPRHAAACARAINRSEPAAYQRGRYQAHTAPEAGQVAVYVRYVGV